MAWALLGHITPYEMVRVEMDKNSLEFAALKTKYLREVDMLHRKERTPEHNAGFAGLGFST